MSLKIGTVHLRTPDADRLVAFYESAIGLRVHRREANTVYMGVGADDLLALIEVPGAVRASDATGLYHFALLLPTRFDLARTLTHLAQTRVSLQGLSDHIVSEAIYLADPDGNGIEIYADRPRSHWYKDGQMQLATLPLDVGGLMAELAADETPWSGLPLETTMGHVHLHVSDIQQTDAFYRDQLGFEMMFAMSTALFMAYDGYHHHLGANIWGGRQRPPADAVGLDHVDLHFDEAAFASILARLGVSAGVDVLEVDDPSGNRLLLHRSL